FLALPQPLGRGWLAPRAGQRAPDHCGLARSHRSNPGELQRRSHQEEDKCCKRGPETHGVESLPAAHHRSPVGRWRTRVPLERGAVDGHGARERYRDEGEQSEHTCTTEAKAEVEAIE